jgi:uncharacterized protein DUF3551
VEKIGGNCAQADGARVSDLIGIDIRMSKHVEMTMKTLILAATLAGATFLHTGSASAQEARIYPWCADETAPVNECTFDTFEQCRQTVRGVGGFCSPNPALMWPRAQVNPWDTVPVPARRRR